MDEGTRGGKGIFLSKLQVVQPKVLINLGEYKALQ